VEDDGELVATALVIPPSIMTGLARIVTTAGGKFYQLSQAILVGRIVAEPVDQLVEQSP
jgi:hypothetical protein